jgi:hypothetical protein
MDNKICNTDDDCNGNNLCSFDETNMENYCIDNSIDNLYYGCFDENSNNNYESIESKIPNSHKNYIDCINFSRKQTNEDGMNYNYMIYRPKRKIFVDVSTINIYLKMNNEIIAVIPYKDYFNLSCDENSENCVLESMESIHNFIKINTMDILRRGKEGKITLEIVYECENEGLKRVQTFDIDLNEYKPLIIHMNCPIEKDNKLFQSKCESIYINPSNDDLYKSIDNKINMNNCVNPLFKVPTIVNDKSKYKKIKNKKTFNEIKQYDEKINEKIRDVYRIEAERYVRLKKMLYGQNVSFEQALKIVSDTKITPNKNKWKIFPNYDAAQKLFSYSENNVEILNYYGKVYTIQEAMDAANKNNQFFFVWYHNSYELDNYASKLFFIDIFSLDESILNKKEWAKSDNVSTCVLNFDMENFDAGYGSQFPANPMALFGTSSEDDLYDIYHSDYIEGGNTLGYQIYNSNLNNLEKLNNILEKSELNANIQSEIEETMEDYILNLKNFNNNILNNLNNKMTTYEQAISMNNYETNINNNILLYLSVILGVFVIILVSLLVYYNSTTAGIISIFGKP